MGVDDAIAAHLEKEENLKRKFSSLIDAYIMASGAAQEMKSGVKGSALYKEAEIIFNEAIAYIHLKKFHER